MFIETNGNSLLCKWESQKHIQGERLAEGVDKIMADTFNRSEETRYNAVGIIKSERRKELETILNL
jgi:hypothetical protein